MVWHPLLEVTSDGVKGLVGEFAYVVDVDAEYLGPTLTPGGSEGEVDVAEGLIDFVIKGGRDIVCLRIPSAYRVG